MERIAILFAIVASLYCAYAVTEEEKQRILDKHNEFRGSVDPPAANMPKLYWHDKLAEVAEKFIQKCPNGHDTVDERRDQVGLNMSIGQNMGFNSSSWEDLIAGWHKESKHFVFGTGGVDGGEVPHFTQETLSNTTHIGCAYKECHGTKWWKYYVCNYAYQITPQDTQTPWKAGEPCSECGGTCSDNVCDCGDVLCINEGRMNTATCQCECKGVYEGPTCADLPAICPEDRWPCGKPRPNGFPPEYCHKWLTVPDVCPHMCKIC